jgi:hypothetical protein
MQAENVSAAALAPVAKLSAGSNAEKVVLGIMEQTGMKTASRSAKDIAADRWRMSAYEQYVADNAAGVNDDLWAQITTMDTTLNSATVTPIPDKPGFGKVLVDSSLYLSVFMLSYDVTSAIRQANVENKALAMWNDTVEKLEGVTKYYSIYNYVVQPKVKQSSGVGWIIWLDEYISGSPVHVTGAETNNDSLLPIFYIKDWAMSGSNIIIYTYAYSYISGSWRTFNLSYTRPFYNSDSGMQYESTPTEVPTFDIPEVLNPYLEPEASPLTHPEGMPEQMEVIVPMDDTGYDSPEPWNEPMPDLNPDPTDPTDPPEEPPSEPGRIDWKKLQPVLSALKTVFPFSIPWDFAAFIGQFNIEPQTPVIPIKIDEQLPFFGKTLPFKFEFNLDFSMFDVVAKITRWGLIISFDIYLITSLRKYTPD